MFKKRLIPTSTGRTDREVMESPSVRQTDFTGRAGTPETVRWRKLHATLLTTAFIRTGHTKFCSVTE